MKISTWMKRKITGRHQSLAKAQAERLARLPKDQARRELGAFLFALAVEHATEFVKDELQRSEQPFTGVPPEALYHEMLAVTFWIMDREIAGGKEVLLPELHDHYVRSYNVPGASREERVHTLERKYARYASEWDDETGHQDEFGLCVAQHLFGTEPSRRTREQTFWIIKYAHDLMQDISPVRKAYRQKLKPDAPHPAGR